MSDLHEVFWDLHERGLSLIPIRSRSKAPPLLDWRKYQHERADAATIKRWLAHWPDANPAIVTGRISGVIVLDADGPEAYVTLAALGGVPATWTVKTPNGHHYYFRYPRHIRRRIKNFVKKLPGVDLRADGGYVMAPGATHPSGGVYSWERGLSPEDVPLADAPDWLLELLDIDDDETQGEGSPQEGEESEQAIENKIDHLAYEGKSLEKPQGISRKNLTQRSRQAYGAAALRREFKKVSLSREGERNDQLNRSAFALGQLVAGDVLDLDLVECELETAARASGLDNDPCCGITGIRATINSGLRAGMHRPRHLSSLAIRTSPQREGRTALTRPEPEDSTRPREPTQQLERSQQSERRELPSIVTTNRPLRDITTDALNALVVANEPPLTYIRSGDLVRVRTDEHRRPRIEILREMHLCGRLARVADFTRYTKNGELRHVTPPVQVVRDIMALGSWPVPILEGVLEAPTLRPDGSILHTSGYDPATRLLYIPAPGLNIIMMPNTPGRDDARRSIGLLEDTLGEFPYVDDASWANTLALLLTPVVRQAFKGHVPLALLDAPRAGTGKSLLGDVVSLIATGRSAAMMSAPSSDEEWRKRLTSALLDGPTVVTIDNVESRLSSASLASVLTAHNWHDRVLGSTSMVTLPQRATWIATGNNIKLGGDLPRRCYWIRLDSQLARPWQRPTNAFRHPNLLAWVGDQRGAILSALLTIARAWHVAGKPAAEVPSLGSFEGWARMLGGILAYAGVNGFLQNLDALYQQNDEEASEWESFLEMWWQAFGERPLTVAELFGVLLLGLPGGQQRFAVGGAASAGAVAGTSGTLPEIQAAALREALPGDLAEGLEIEQKRGGTTGSSASGFRRRLGKALAKRVDVRYGDLRLERAGDDAHQKVGRWRVRDMRDMRS